MIWHYVHEVFAIQVGRSVAAPAFLKLTPIKPFRSGSVTLLRIFNLF
jgi:hypothetical protein